VNANSEPVIDTPIESGSFGFEAVFHAQYSHIARIIARVVKIRFRAEDLAAEVFWKLWKTPRALGPNVSGWLYRTAMRVGLDSSSQQCRREKYERMFDFLGSADAGATPRCE